MRTWEGWQKELTNSLGAHEYLVKNKLSATYTIENPLALNQTESIQIKYSNPDSAVDYTLNIDSYSYKKIFDAIASPVYSWEQAQKDALKKCVAYVQKWAYAKGIANAK